MTVLSEPALEAGLDTAAARRAMIDSQLRPSGVNDARVLAAMAAAPREDYVPAHRRAVAYSDRAVPLGAGRVLAPPLSHGRMLTEAMPTAADKALIVGGGSGYLAALLAPLVGTLHVVESETALDRIGGARAGTWVAGPLAQGCKKAAPYTLLLIDGAIEVLPDALARQLADDGRVVTGLIENGVARLAVGRKAAGAVGFLTLGEADFAPLPGFARPRRWSF
jgi:protein-L-isoaspartate(D-aspartate) O-methyltransferase